MHGDGRWLGVGISGEGGTCSERGRRVLGAGGEVAVGVGGTGRQML